MRKLAPLFLTTSILALAAGNAVAMGDFKKQKAPETTTSSTVSPSASPTVPANTQNPQGNSYSDKSSSAPGTNAKMDSNSTAVSPTASTATTSGTLSGQPKDTADALANEDKKVLSNSSSSGADRNAGTSGTMSEASSSMTEADKHNKVVSPTDKSKKAKKKVAKADTNAAAAESSTGKSPGGASQ